MIGLFLVCLMVAYIGSTDVAANCEVGWREFNNNCYYFSPKKLNWHDARKTCERKKAGLATVTCVDEHNFIAEQIILEGTRDNWIGGNDIKREGLWAWEHSGEHVRASNFTAWNPGQPNDKKKEQNCLLMDEGCRYNWNDFKCTSRYSFVCEKPSKQETCCQATNTKCCGCPVHC
uniref:C-type lectin 5 n=1 Tax=Anadara kagoshimensis TaxID=1390362 RepID=A0A7G7XXY7_9BIVA|nr:C-type lectin 5 [Anadara sativa]